MLSDIVAIDRLSIRSTVQPGYVLSQAKKSVQYTIRRKKYSSAARQRRAETRPSAMTSLIHLPTPKDKGQTHMQRLFVLTGLVMTLGASGPATAATECHPDRQTDSGCCRSEACTSARAVGDLSTSSSGSQLHDSPQEANMFALRWLPTPSRPDAYNAIFGEGGPE
jgi:hypothetical protein